MTYLLLVVGLLFPIVGTEEHTLAPKDLSGEIKKTIYVTTTAYSEYDSCHYENCIMASGKRAYIGAVACPRDIPLDTKVTLDGVEYVCEDRYQRGLGERYDIFMGFGKEASKAAKEYGVRKSVLTF